MIRSKSKWQFTKGKWKVQYWAFEQKEYNRFTIKQPQRPYTTICKTFQGGYGYSSILQSEQEKKSGETNKGPQLLAKVTVYKALLHKIRIQYSQIHSWALNAYKKTLI